MAASTMSGSWPTILLGSFGSRYMTGGRVGSRPTLSVLPASPGYFAAALSGSHAACAELQTSRASAPAINATMLLQRCRVISASCSSSTAGSARSRRSPSLQVLPTSGAAQQLPIAGHDLSPCQREDGHAPDLESMERVIPGPRMQTPFVDGSRSRRIEEHQIRVAADRDRTLPGI